MSRIRWYHFFFVLSLFDVVVILSSLELHRRTLENTETMQLTAVTLDDESRSIQRMQEAILALNKPGNDLFQGERDLREQTRRLEGAKIRIKATLDDAAKKDIPVGDLTETVARLTTAAQSVFDQFRSIESNPTDTSANQRRLVEAGKAMAQMDDQAQLCMAILGRLTQMNASRRIDFLAMQETEISRRLEYERIFIAAVIVILVGMLYFGRRLQAADRDLELERRRVKEERRERLAQIGEICSSVAHGIRNPLAAMRSSAQLTLELGKIDEDSRERVNDILSEGRRLGDRVTRLLNFARAKVDAFQKVDLRDLVAESIREIEPELTRRGIRAERILPDSPIPVNGDRHQLQQVVIELLSNAMELSKSGDAIQVACRPPDAAGMTAIVVTDQGPGVPAEVRGRIFDLFFTTKPTGTGIGLATVRRIARLHGGDVTLADAPTGHGAMFVVMLPKAGLRTGPDSSLGAVQ